MHFYPLSYSIFLYVILKLTNQPKMSFKYLNQYIKKRIDIRTPFFVPFFWFFSVENVFFFWLKDKGGVDNKKRRVNVNFFIKNCKFD